MAGGIHLCGILLGKFLILTDKVESSSCAVLIAGSVILIVTVLWQIPLCLLLAKRFGMIAAVLFNAVGGIVFGVITATTRFWWLCPYSYSARLMIPILKILPNGLPAEEGNSLLSGNVILPGVVVSILLFIALSMMTANWFARQEVRG
jgi:ABC-2 type transport system permease protein